jgi:NadR type nicotinamide-nucleotide adenylyltransferase
VTRFGQGLVVGRFYPPHAGHHHLIDTAAARCERLTVVVAPASWESISLSLRCQWLRERHPGVEVVGEYDDHPVDYADPRAWEAHCAVFRRASGLSTVDAVFTSEGYGDELARRFGAVHVCVDRDRSAVPVSGTAVRADPVAYWDRLAPPTRAWFVRRVVVVGAESTGTTTVARDLAAHYGTVWVPEYGRELTLVKAARVGGIDNVEWDTGDFVEVARVQNEWEDRAARESGPVLVCDTDARATAVWQERYLGVVSPQVASAARDPHLYLLTDHAGVPFEDDGLRDGEHVRPWMTQRFRAVLAGTGVPVVELTGSREARRRTAVEAVDALLAKGWSLVDPWPAPDGRIGPPKKPDRRSGTSGPPAGTGRRGPSSPG